uniref:vacuolar protein sorting-associated protein 51 homolog n=1 Tax=Myxine glutinosa TaxID=7769 RepID=UPI00358F659C
MAASDRGPAEEAPPGRRPHGRLKEFYGVAEKDDPCDIDGAKFDPDVFMTKLRRECSLAKLMDFETDMVRKIRLLDSDMQTLVYENYNKFISATDTIRKMKNDFKKMEDEMESLAANMASITEFSGKIGATLQDRRRQITKLSGVHTLLRKLQFLFELPALLARCVELQKYAQAVRYYIRAQDVLQQYKHMPSFHGIQDDCEVIVAKLALSLRSRFQDRDVQASELAECVDLLLQLGEPADQLWEEFLAHASTRIQHDLQLLQAELGSDQAPPSDILDFVDKGCNGFIGDLSLVIASYQVLFVVNANQQQATLAQEKLLNFLKTHMESYFGLVEHRLQEERGLGDNTLLVRALDRFHRRLQALTRLLPGSNVVSQGLDIVERAAKMRLVQYGIAMQEFFSDCITDARQALAAPRCVGKDLPSLVDLLGQLSTALLNKVKAVLVEVQLFCSKDITFSVKSYFKGDFCTQGVREGLVVGFVKHMCQVACQFCEPTRERAAAPPALLLLLSRLCLDYETSTISYILTLTDEQFLGQNGTPVTSVSSLCGEVRAAAQKLLNHYVKQQGLSISQMLRKSVETRDWVNTIEPRNVRAVMKRVVEDVTAIDIQVGLLYEEGVRKAHSSDSSKRTFSAYSSSRQQSRYAPSYTTSAPMDTSLLSNIQKLFSERVDIFSTVEFSKVSVLTGIIKISLKTFLECVRLRTFGRYGLQQVQVDCHYLQLYLWRFVSDERLCSVLLDEVVGSTLQRCLDSVSMEPSVIEVICERG